MKLVIVTTVSAFQKDVLKLFKQADIEAFSSSEIDGYKTAPSLMATQTWFPSEKGGHESLMFFSFTKASKIESLFKLIESFNNQMETNNPCLLYTSDAADE